MIVGAYPTRHHWCKRDKGHLRCYRYTASFQSAPDAGGLRTRNEYPYKLCKVQPTVSRGILKARAQCYRMEKSQIQVDKKVICSKGAY